MNLVLGYDNFGEVIQQSDIIMVGGGNTFHLVHYLHQNGLIPLIRKAVQDGKPYIGWSAGANVACPTLCTTNDMPIIKPPSFKALDLIPFQINPHYTEEVIPNHGGESRVLRIMEFIEANKEMMVIGLGEGMIIQLKNGHYDLIGNKPVKIFQHGMEPYFIQSSEELNQVLSKS